MVRNLRGWVIAACALTLLGALVGFFVLPERLVVQVSASGTPANTLPKLAGLLLPLALAAFGLYWYRREGTAKGALVAFVSTLVMALVFVFNLK